MVHFVKFNFPQAAALTNLAWGALSFRTAYQAAGEWENVLVQIKWGTDYFIKCHSEPNVLYGQVGNGHIDHAHWHRPEEIQYETPAYKIDVNNVIFITLIKSQVYVLINSSHEKVFDLFN